MSSFTPGEQSSSMSLCHCTACIPLYTNAPSHSLFVLYAVPQHNFLTFLTNCTYLLWLTGSAAAHMAADPTPHRTTEFTSAEQVSIAELRAEACWKPCTLSLPLPHWMGV